MELLGTFFLALAVSFTSFTGNPIPVGLMLMAMIYVGAHISGAHYNPAVSFAVFMRNKLSMEDMLMYMGSQIVGALLAIWFFGVITETVFSPEVPTEIPMGFSVGMEALLTFVLCITILSVFMLDRYKNHVIQGVVVGLTLMAIVSIGGIFNPAIAFAAMVCNMMKNGAFVGMSPALIYIVGPLLGGAAAAIGYGFFNDKR